MLIKKLFYPSLLAVMLLVSSFVAGQNNEKQALVLISTNLGDIKLVLYNETPQHRDNFIKLVKEKMYDGTLFHRVMNTFMIQGGDPDSKNAEPGVLLGDGNVGYTIPGEPDMVNPQKESSGCQFYIVQGRTFTRAEVDKMLERKNKGREEAIEYTEEQYQVYETLGGAPHLDMDYTVFGEVVEGLEVVDKIATAETDRKNRPVSDIKMTVKIVKK